MVEYVFKPQRTRDGKRTVSRLYSGRYSLGRGQKPVTVALHTPDPAVAMKKLRAIIIEKQSEAVGILAPRAMRNAAASPLVDLVAAYAADLKSRATSPHVKESLARIHKVITECKWARLADVTPSSWVAWRAKCVGSARTVRAHQTSIVAFLNWLVRMEMLAVNPLARVGAVSIRGKSVRQSRAFTHEEFSRLLAVAPAHRRIVYLFLGYTGTRKAEARKLRWDMVDLQRGLVTVLGKGAKVRVVPLRAELVDLLGESRPLTWSGPSGLHSPALAPVFPVFPSDDALHADLRRAGIERKDGSARVLHFHAFRKTFQTWGAVAGVGQRSAQELLGHSDPSLTAGVYTDANALRLADEVAKLPWLGSPVPVGGVAGDAQFASKTPVFERFRALLGELESLAQVVVPAGASASPEAAFLGCPTWIRTMTR